MAQVQIIEPWHVAVLDAARRFVPRSAPMRTVMTATASAVAIALTSGGVWLALHTDLALYSFNLAAARARGALMDGAASVIAPHSERAASTPSVPAACEESRSAPA